MAQEQQLAKQRLVYSILKFLEREIQTESTNAERRESIEGRLDTTFNYSEHFLVCFQSLFNVWKHLSMFHSPIHRMNYPSIFSHLPRINR